MKADADPHSMDDAIRAALISPADAEPGGMGEPEAPVSFDGGARQTPPASREFGDDDIRRALYVKRFGCDPGPDQL